MEIDTQEVQNIKMNDEDYKLFSKENVLSLGIHNDDYNELVKAYNDSINNKEKFQSNIYQLKRKFLKNQDQQREQRRSISSNPKLQLVQNRINNNSPQMLKTAKNAKNAFNSKLNKHKMHPQQKPTSQLKPTLRNILKSTQFQDNLNQFKGQVASEQQFEDNDPNEQAFIEQIDSIVNNFNIIYNCHLKEIPLGMQQLEMYSIGRLIGSGATAEVKLARHKTLDLPIAMKIYDRKKMSSQTQKNLEREVDILKKISHPNIIKLHHVMETPTQYYLAMEYASPTCLDTYMRGKPYKRVAEEEGKQIFRQIVDAIFYLHSMNILHRDMKLENLLIDYTTKKVKLIDFGYSVIIDPNIKAQTSCGTPSYMAPEIVKKLGYSFGADVWACGIILYKLITGVFPFRGNSEADLFKKISSGKIEYPSFVTNGVKQLISQMLKTDANNRIPIEDVKQNFWLNPIQA